MSSDTQLVPGLYKVRCSARRPLRKACAIALPWEMGRCFKKDCLAFGTVWGRSKPPFSGTPCFCGRGPAVSGPEGGGHSGPRTLLSLTEEHLPCVNSSLTFSRPAWTELPPHTHSFCFLNTAYLASHPEPK